METYFIITNFEDGWREEEFIYEETLFDYCIEVLDIPEEKILEIQYSNDTMELTLTNMEIEDTIEDWYVNLYKVSNRS